MKRLADGRPEIARPRVIYADLDGTLLGPGGSLFATATRVTTPSLRAATAVHRLHDAGVDLVLASGRGRRGMFEPARILGAHAYIAELGALLVEQLVPEEIVVRNFGAYEGDGSPYQAMVRSGAGAYLIERFDGLLEPHTPWTRFTREATMLLRGLVDPVEATGALADSGYGWLELQDNGRVHRTSPTLQLPELHVFHLTPRGVSKVSAVRLHRERNGIPSELAVAIGDSRADLDIASEVAAVCIVANGAGSLGDPSTHPENVWVADAPHGDGFAEAVELLLAQD